MTPSTSLECPACGSAAMSCFYGPLRVPTQSNRLLRSLDEAIAQPTGALELALCGACGLICNVRFDPASQQLDDSYEATQGFSPTFNAFLQKLARGWIDRYAIGRDTTALEIGCGRGEFIELLAQLSGCKAIGIDPIANPSESRERVRFIRERLEQLSEPLDADFICCRHTLEHIPEVSRFVETIAALPNHRSRVPVCFEVPDTLRVLRENAFWDIYYEHCSYFTPGSVARLFREADFTVRDLRLEYDGQYIILEASSGKHPEEHPSLDLEADLDATRHAVDVFAKQCRATLDHWRETLDRHAVAGKAVALWGSGSKAVGFLTTLNVDRACVAQVVDINPHKQDTFLPMTGQEIVAPDRLRQSKPDLVIAMNPIYRAEIRRSLDEMGLTSTELTAL